MQIQMLFYLLFTELRSDHYLESCFEKGLDFGVLSRQLNE